MLIRAIGPGLRLFNVNNFCKDPRVTLYNSAGQIIAENDNWQNSQDMLLSSYRVGAFNLTTGSKDSALIITLYQGSYTALATCANGDDGVVALEIYDLDWETGQGISNLSALGRSGPGENSLITGVAIGGSGQDLGWLLFRAVGPGLAQFGVDGFLPDPVITLREIFGGGNIIVSSNDDWGTRFSNYFFTSRGAFALPLGSRDAAVIYGTSKYSTGGAFTVVVEEKNNLSGVVLVELYVGPDISP